MEINLETLLGTLAAYFAIMAVLAVGTEVVLDILKIKALKEPVSPSDTLNGLKQWIRPEEWENIDTRVEYMRQIIKDLDDALATAHAGVTELRQQAQPILKEANELTSGNLAIVMSKLQARYQALTNNRLAWIRFFSLAIGIAWAMLLQINSLDLLAPVLPDNVASVLGGTSAVWYQVAGRVLSGLGAAAGSSFWYEQMARLRQARKVVDTAAELKEQVTSIAGGIATP